VDKKQSTVIKGLAILMIVLYHQQYNLASLTYLIIRGEGPGHYFERIAGMIAQNVLNVVPFLYYLGFSAVGVFFILSGLGLTIKYTKQKLNFKNYSKQIIKLLLPYFIAIPITFLINYSLQYLWLQRGIISQMPQPFEIYTPNQYLESYMVFTRWFNDRLALNFVGTWWFVGIILQFYLLFPILLRLSNKLGAKNLLIISLVLSFVYRGVVALTTNSSPVGIQGAELLYFINFPARLPEFAFGIYLAQKPDILKYRYITIFGILLFLGGLILSTTTIGLAFNDFFLGSGLLLILFKIAKSISSSRFNIFELFGKYSYQIYLYHEPALKMIAKFVFPDIF
jgi:peptidoglycan/LPS O-acetylase OafA/YrhL